MNPLAAGQMTSSIALQHAANNPNANGFMTGGTMEGKYGAFWLQFEATFRKASEELQAAGIAWMVDMLTPVLIIVTITLGLLMASGQISGHQIQKYGGRTLLMLWLVVGGAWAGTITTLVIDDFPTEIARRIYGGSAGMQVLDQFAIVDGMIKGMGATALGQATGIMNAPANLFIRVNVFCASMANDLMFIVWTVMRMMLYMVVTMGAFMLVFLPFDSTIGIFKQMVGKIVGLTFWQLGANVTVKVLLTGTITRLDGLTSVQVKSLGNIIDMLQDCAAWNVWMLFLFLMIPAFAGYMSGIAASQTAVQGAVLSGAAMVVGGARSVAGGIASATNRTVARLNAAPQRRI